MCEKCVAYLEDVTRLEKNDEKYIRDSLAVYKALTNLVDDLCARATIDNGYQIDGKLLEAANNALDKKHLPTRKII